MRMTQMDRQTFGKRNVGERRRRSGTCEYREWLCVQSRGNSCSGSYVCSENRDIPVQRVIIFCRPVVEQALYVSPQ